MDLSRREFLGAIAAPAFLTPRDAEAALGYALSATPIADKTYVVYGVRELFTVRNGGNISNSSFIDTADGAVVIDTGSSRLYGEALRAAYIPSRHVGAEVLYSRHEYEGPDDQRFPEAVPE